MKKRLLNLALLLLLSVAGYAQTVTGRVTSATDGSPVPGVSILVKGTSTGTSTDADGQFSLAATENSTLVVSFIGFKTKEVIVGTQTSINITLDEDVTELSEVVVTALGIAKEKKSLTYSMQEVNGDKLTQVQDVNFINGLTGKVPGLFINKSASGVGGSVRVVLRGQKSTRENQPLYVIDGVPLANTNSAQSTDIWSGRDGGDILSTLNPADIESMSVLKGASASALYGSQGQNGVILITTKKGKAGSTSISFSSNLTFEKPMYYPGIQRKYGQTAAGTTYSWGVQASSEDHVKPFFQTGKTWINSVSLAAGNEKAQTYFSYSNTDNDGILPTSSFKQHTLTFRETAKISDKFSIDGNIILSNQKVHNRITGGLYFNPITGLYLFPRGLDFDQYKEFEYLSSSRGILLQDWWNINHDAGMVGQDNQQNPYWILNRNPNDQNRQNVFSSLTLKYSLMSWLTIQARGNVNRIEDKYEQDIYASTQGTLSDYNGRFILQRNRSTLLYGDLLLTGDRNLSDKVGISFNVGGSIRHSEDDNLAIDSKGADLLNANVFTVGNIKPSSSMATFNQAGPVSETQSVFGTVTMDFSKMVYADLTLRNDWSSTLAYTSKLKSGYLYFSGGVNAIVSDMITLPSAISFLKIRASYAKVGNGVEPYATLPVNTYNAGNFVKINDYLPSGLLPEDHRAVEAGVELRLLQDRFSVDFTLYKTNTYDQFFRVDANRGSSYAAQSINAGNIENKGIELGVSADVIKTANLTWNTSVNFTRNINSVIELTEKLSSGQYPITAPGVNNYGLYLTKGGSYGDIYGKKFERYEGKIVVDVNGKPAAATGMQNLGNPNPKALLGWSNTLSYKKLTVSALVDARIGGKVMSITQAMMDEFGVSEVTADARDAGGVNVPAVVRDGETIVGDFEGPIPAELFYTTVGGRAGITEYYMYDATNVRLRELSIGYRFPDVSVFRNITLSIVGRNLFFIQKDAPFDPELSMSTGNGVQGVDTFVLPSTRSLGANVRWNF
jgi:TonB-linked SusC/RagA family outer membrane protein